MLKRLRTIFDNQKIRTTCFLVLLLVLSAIPRFAGLGYSHFYGDETKTLYVDKTIPAEIFFLDQRKGPVQFLVVWAVETFTGGFNEMNVRLPFAVAGTLAVLVFYFLVRKMFDEKTAAFASVLYAFSGFSIAFSRTAQYQSFLQLFSFLGLYFFIWYQKTQRRLILFGSSLWFTLAFYCHYDAVFYALPVLAFVSKVNLKEVLKYFVLPITILVLVFYAPYIFKGYFNTNTIGYINKRISPTPDTLPNNSMYTILVYNPLASYLALLFVGFLLFASAFLKSKDKFYMKFLLLWFTVPFLAFTYIFRSPGTHIQNYLVPVYIMSSLGVIYGISFSKSPSVKKYTPFVVVLVLLLQIISSMFVFIPELNTNYPWKSSSKGLLFFPQAERKYQLFLYGFPYNRNWKEISNFLYSQEGARGFYTNDNAVLAKYYVMKLDYTEPGSNFYPQYYVYVYNNQEFKYPSGEFMSRYVSVFRVGSGVEPDAIVFKRLD